MGRFADWAKPPSAARSRKKTEKCFSMKFSIRANPGLSAAADENWGTHELSVREGEVYTRGRDQNQPQILRLRPARRTPLRMTSAWYRRFDEWRQRMGRNDRQS